MVEEISKYIDEKCANIFDFFEVEVPEKLLIINIISTKDEFDKLFETAWGYAPENYARGFAKDNVITYLSIFEYDHTTQKYNPEDFDKALLDYKKTVVHEIVHYVNNLFRQKHNCGYTERYISEGLAICLSGQKDDLKVNFDCSLDSLLLSKDNYNGYYLVTKYLLDNYNKELIFDLIKSNRKPREFLVNELYDRAKNHYNSTNSEKIHN